MEEAGLTLLEKRHSEMFEGSKFQNLLTKFGFANDHRIVNWSQRKSGFPGKNTAPVLGKPMAWYPMKTAKSVAEIDKTYLSTDDPELMSIARSLDVELIERPDYLANDEALGDHAFSTWLPTKFAKDWKETRIDCFAFL